MISPELSRRIAAAMQHAMTPDERGDIVDAVDDSDAETLEGLPEDIQALVIALEGRPFPTLEAVGVIPYPTAEGSEDFPEEASMADAILAAQ